MQDPPPENDKVPWQYRGDTEPWPEGAWSCGSGDEEDEEGDEGAEKYEFEGVYCGVGVPKLHKN